MATADLLRELAVLRLAGATCGQVLRVVAAETLTVVVVGACAVIAGVAAVLPAGRVLLRRAVEVAGSRKWALVPCP
jgi:putative ABC transport system permease protein